MSDIDEFANQSENKATSIQSTQQIELKPLYRLFTSKLLALLFTIIMMVGLMAALFYQNNVQNNALVENQLVGLTQQLKKITALQKANELVKNLLVVANVENYVSLHAELIATDRQLLQLNSSNGQLFQQWLNKHRSAEDIVSRIQDSDTRNQQLKQSSIIQLQLMLFSMTPIIDKKLTQHKSLQQQLKVDQGRVIFSKADAYLKSAQQLSDLQTLQALLANILVNFEQLTMYTPIAKFELLRLNVERVFVQNDQLKSNQFKNNPFINKRDTKAMADVSQQIDTFEKIVITEQRALAKWQGYIRLAQDYHANLKAQQHQINQLLITPYKPKPVKKINVVQDLLTQFNVQLSDKNITAILVLAIVLSLLIFCYLLWQLREQIRGNAQQSIGIIQSSLQANKECVEVANCVETQIILEQMQSIAKPKHDEQEFQVLSEKYELSQQLIEKKNQVLVQLEKSNEQQQLNFKKRIDEHRTSELQRYQYLADNVLSLVQQQQTLVCNSEALVANDSFYDVTKIGALYQQLSQFYLALEMQLDDAVLSLEDINLVDEIHAILFNKQGQQQHAESQLYFSYDEQLISHVKIDFRLFQQLINLFIDISLDFPLDLSLDKRQASQLHFHVQVQDKSAGKQRVCFSLKVKNESLDTLPNSIKQLLESQSSIHGVSPLIDIFNLLLTKQHGENIVAQIMDDGYQVSFELPLANATTIENNDNISLENITVMLLSNNTLLTGLLESYVQSAQGKFEKIARIDSFQQQVNAKDLNRRKLDLLIVASDIAFTNLELITEQIKALPQSLQPKVMVLQSSILSYQRFGFYSQAEQLLCKDNFLHNIKLLLASDKSNNQLYLGEQFTKKQHVENQLSLLLGVQSPQYSQNLHRLLQWLGFQVQVVVDEASQKTLWKTGQYSLLFTEFTSSALLEMTRIPLVDIGVFSLTDTIPQVINSSYYERWHIGKLDKESSVVELTTALAPWLKQSQQIEVTSSKHAVNDEALTLQGEGVDESEELVITEVAKIYSENNSEAVFDFAQYLQHQGSVELALFMLDEYTQDNHQQLDLLVEAIKEKNIKEAQLIISALALNAKILSAQELKSLCAKWSKLLTGSEIPSSLKKINALLKDTRLALTEIDEYAETI